MQVNRINKFKRDRKLMDEALKSMRTKLWEHFTPDDNLDDLKRDLLQFQER